MLTNGVQSQYRGESAEQMEQENPNIQSKCAVIHYGGISDTGKVRPENQDAFLIEPEMGLFLVSDGMGGVPGGALASKIVVDVLPKIIKRRTRNVTPDSMLPIQDLLQREIVNLSERVRMEGRKNGYQKMGATLVLGLICDGQSYIAHVGDSRAYLFRDDGLVPLTTDHSIVGLLLQYGLITPEVARRYQGRGRITRYVGMEGPVSPDVRIVDIKRGDRILLCTDGLHGIVPETEMSGILKAFPDPDDACRALINAANAAGGTDNITAVVMDWEAISRLHKPSTRIEPPESGVGSRSNSIARSMSANIFRQRTGLRRPAHFSV